jgi:hypothetical protein
MTRARDLSKLANPEVFSVDSSNNVGVNSLTPDAKLDIVGVVSATEYYGDGSKLTGIIAGSTLSASNGTQRLVVTSQTTGSMTEAATNSDITYDTGTAVLSATKFSGTLLGNSTGLQGTPSINVQDITAETVSIAGTISYENVANVDSVGIITARSGINVTGGKIDGRLGNYSETLNTIGNTASNVTIDVADGTYVTATLAQSTTFAFSSPQSGSLFGFTLQLTNGSGGPYTITWPPSVKWSNNIAPVRTTTDGRIDIWNFFTSDGGTNWYGSISLFNFVG